MESVSDRRKPLVRLIAIVLTCVFIGSLLPVLAAARYAAPESDDLLYGQDAHDALAVSPALGTLVSAAADKVAHHHAIAHGRYANTFFGSAFLGAFGLDHYWSVPVILLLALIVGTLLFTYALLCRVLRADIWTWLALSMFVLLFCVQLLPSPAEGLFWFCGGLGYTLYYGSTLTMLSLLLLVQASQKRVWRVVCGALAVLLAIVVAGLGFTVMLVTAALLIGYVAFAVVQKRKDMLLFGVLTLAVFAVGCVIQLTAPATGVRAAWEQEMYGYTGMGPVKAILLSFVYAFCTLLHRLDGGMLCYIAMVALLLAPCCKASGCRFRLPLVVLAGSFCLYATMFTASLYATGSMGPYRQWNLMYFAMFPFWGVNAAYLTGFFIRRMEARSDGEGRWTRLCTGAGGMAAKRRVAVLMVIATLMLSSVLIHGVYDTTCVAAVQELRHGSAAARHAARMAELYEGAKPVSREASRLFLY